MMELCVCKRSSGNKQKSTEKDQRGSRHSQRSPVSMTLRKKLRHRELLDKVLAERGLEVKKLSPVV